MLSGILFSEGQTFSFGANVGLGLFLGFFDLLALLTLDGTFEARRECNGGGIPDGLDQKSWAVVCRFIALIALVKTICHRAIAASIWKRQATSGFEYIDFTVSRSWKTSTTGKEGYSSSFFARNANELHAVIQEASDWIESQQASLQESNDFKAQTILQKAA